MQWKYAILPRESIIGSVSLGYWPGRCQSRMLRFCLLTRWRRCGEKKWGFNRIGLIVSKPKANIESPETACLKGRVFSHLIIETSYNPGYGCHILCYNFWKDGSGIASSFQLSTAVLEIYQEWSHRSLIYPKDPKLNPEGEKDLKKQHHCSFWHIGLAKIVYIGNS